MKELWKLAKGYEKYIAVSNLGNVKAIPVTDVNNNYKPEKNKTVHIHRSGYKYIMLSIQGEQKFLLLHRLVAEAFIPNPLNLEEVNHKDLDKGNCLATNLEWCTRQENMTHASANGAFNSPKNKAKPAKKVMLISKEGATKTYPSINACARDIGGFSTNISACLKGKLKTYKGYTFSYV